MRVILFTGKGGVGKTSVSASTALMCSKLGYKTMVMSTDAAHSLSDSFDRNLTDKPTKITENLFALEINPQHEIKENWGVIQEYITLFLSSRGINDVVAEELSVFPGMEELFSLIKIKRYNNSKEFDVVIVDCAPTGATLRLLSFPDIIKWYMKHLFNIERKTMKAIRPLANRVLKVPLPTDEVYGSIEDIYKNVEGFSNILRDNTKTTVRLVMNPEKMVIKETHRAFTYLCLYDISVDSIIVNKVLPEDITDSYFDRWKELQTEHLQTIKESFSSVPIKSIKLFNKELVGLQLLEQMGKNLYGNEDPTKIYYSGTPIKIIKEKNQYTLNLQLPFTEKRDIDLYHKGDELILKVGNQKRSIVLPIALVDKSIVEAKYVDDTLKIKFEGEGE
ncbi:MAG: ArsA family ATPase [Methanosarcinales archaeon]